MRAAAAIELPGVPGADDGRSMERPMGKRSAGMGAGAIHGMYLAIGIAERQPGLAVNDFVHLAGRHLGHARHSSERHHGED